MYKKRGKGNDQTHIKQTPDLAKLIEKRKIFFFTTIAYRLTSWINFDQLYLQ